MVLGFGIAFLVILLSCKITKTPKDDPILVGLMAIAGGITGVVALNPIIKLPGILINWEDYAQMPVGEFFGLLFGAMIFYGGLIGGVLAAFLFCRGFKLPFLKMADIIAPAIPIGHAFGRLGCLFGGCCYGMEVDASHPFAIVYPQRTDQFADAAAPAGVPLLAVPLIEAVGNVIIGVVILAFLILRNKSKTELPAGLAVALYGLLYGIQRFTLEFFRGDLVRGVYGSAGISTSQIISICVVAGALAILIVAFIKNNKHQKEKI
jgi:phosphatidylglycerol:prolipoprotein diacylglycerol transferase